MDKPKSNVNAQDIVDVLRNYEGEYHYPSGLLASAADEIMRLRSRIDKLNRQVSEMGWRLSPDRMGS